MAAIGSLYPTIVDLIKRQDPNGSIAQIVEALTKKNAFMEDIAWKEGNLTTGHKFTSRTALPTLTWRRLNQGIDPSKSETEQVTETCGMLEGLSKIDEAEVELAGDGKKFRATEDDGFVQSYGLELARAFMYESAKTNPDRIHGIMPRLDATAGNPAAAQIIKAAGGDGGADQTSILLVGWSQDTVFGIYPKGSAVGLQTKDMGLQLTKDPAGKEFPAYVSHFKWNVGLCIRDSRYVVRMCNVDTSNWKADLSAGVNIPNLMTDGYTAIHDPAGVQLVYYMNRPTFAMFNKQLQGKTNNYLEWIERGGTLIPHFLGVPIRIMDAITSSEAVVS